MRYVIIGAGAIGGTFGALLFENGHPIVLVARGAHLDVLRSKGLRFVTPRGVSTLAIPAIAGPEEIDLQPDDVLVLCVKSQDTAAVLARWADRPVAGGGVAADRLPVVCAQNGVENERVALRRFARVYAMAVILPAGHLEPGQVTAVSDPVVGVLTLGVYPSGTDELAERIGADLTAARLPTTVVEQVRPWKYAKLLRNLANAIEAVCGPPLDEPDAVRLRARLVDEARTVLTAAGIAVADEAEYQAGFSRITMRDVAEGARPGGSSWQSLARGTGSIEAAYLNGEIVLLARLHGVPAPVNALLQRLAEQAAAQAIAPGSISAAEVLAQL